MNLNLPGRWLLLLASVLLFFSIDTRAQVGVKFMQYRPGGDLGNTYKRGLAWEAYATMDWGKNQRMRTKLGFMHTGLSPRLDTFLATGSIGSGSELEIVPGYEVYNKFTYNSIFIDHYLRIVKYKSFSLHGGIGLMVGFTKARYSRYVENIIHEQDAVIMDKAGGVRGILVLSYNVSPHLYFTAEAAHAATTATDWSTSYAHNTFGISINYHFWDPAKL